MIAKRRHTHNFFAGAFLFPAGILFILLYVAAFFVGIFFPVVNALFTVYLLLILSDTILLFFIAKTPDAVRKVSERLGNGEDAPVMIDVFNSARFTMHVKLIDELPAQLQVRDFVLTTVLKPHASHKFRYVIRPQSRGTYEFGDLNIFFESPLRLVRRRNRRPAETSVKVYPAFAVPNRAGVVGDSSLERTGSKSRAHRGQSLEFEQVKDYVSGDDIRNINWKTTARRGNLMVNQFIDERSQQIYCLIDKGRLMKMPFNGLTLLDYAINATLALTNICLQKHDRIGLISFSNKPGTLIAADARLRQRQKIMQALYNETTDFLESDFEALYLRVRQHIKQRSLLILFTNFESAEGMQRNLNYLRLLNRYHLLLVVFFENTGINEVAVGTASNIEEVYRKTIAAKFVMEKKLIVKAFNREGILALQSTPEQLGVNTINRYLRLKAGRAL